MFLKVFKSFQTFLIHSVKISNLGTKQLSMFPSWSTYKFLQVVLLLLTHLM